MKARLPFAPDELAAVRRPLASARLLPVAAYANPDVLAFEMERIFHRAWLCVAREQDLPVPGSWMLSHATPAGLLLVRAQDRTLRAFHNVCPHRASSLVRGERGRFARVQCPYHGWTFSLEGALIGAPHTMKLRNFRREDHALRSLPTSVWEGFVFVRPSGDSPSLPRYLSPVPEPLARFDLASLVRARSVEHIVRANWKLLAENFAESHHFPYVHPELNRLTPYGRSASLPTRGRWQGGTMQLAAGVETVSMDGATHDRPLLAARDEVDRGKVYDFLLWPNLLLSVQPDYLLTYRLWPIDCRTTRVVAEIHFAPGTSPAKPCATQDVFEFWDRTNAQDRDACERQQIGVESGAYAPGRYAEVEDGTQRFDQMVVQAYLGK
ncbi:MAG: aromatic ring-hydroxylating dioxygenase subunit alpha [Deltaproteobacteria bacterium]|nr:aromatic ring-hydroxylating dioxygenase subunit alpha [Deltaproteobacteria bacterium]